MSAARRVFPRKEPRGQRDLSLPFQEWRFEVGRGEAGSRLDEFLARRLGWRSRASIRRTIEASKVEVKTHKDPQGAPVGRLRAGLRLRLGQEVVARLDAPHVDADRELEGEHGFELEVVFDDEDLLAVSKPPQISVYPTRRHRAGSLIQLVHARERARGTSTSYPPTLCHRLDRETSGLVVFARNRESRACVSDQFERRTVRKRYLALVVGEVDDEQGLIDQPLGRDLSSRVEIKSAVVDGGSGQEAVTSWRLVRRLDGRSLLEVTPETGRQHQIRVHLAAIGHPLVGDKLYLGGDEVFLRWLEGGLSEPDRELLGLDRHALHAWRLDLDHPSSGERITLEAPLWPDLARLAG